MAEDLKATVRLLITAELLPYHVEARLKNGKKLKRYKGNVHVLAGRNRQRAAVGQLHDEDGKALLFSLVLQAQSDLSAAD